MFIDPEAIGIDIDDAGEDTLLRTPPDPSVPNPENRCVN
jgi:hypothetical protein